MLKWSTLLWRTSLSPLRSFGRDGSIMVVLSSGVQAVIGPSNALDELVTVTPINHQTALTHVVGKLRLLMRAIVVD